MAPHLDSKLRASGPTRISRGLRFIVASAFFFSLMSLLVKAAGRRIPSMEIVLARAIVSFGLSYWLVRRARLNPWGSRRGILFLRGLFGFLALSAFFYSLTHLPIAEATVLQYLSPLFTVLLAAAFLRERLSASVLVPALFCLAGVILVSRPEFVFGVGDLDRVAVMIAVAGSIMSAAAYVAVREASRTEDPLIIVFWFPLVVIPAAIPFVIGDFVWPRGWEWAALLGVGVCTQIAQIFLTRGLALEPAGRAMGVGYVQIVFAALWGAVFFAEFPVTLSLLGSTLIIGGTLWVSLRSET